MGSVFCQLPPTCKTPPCPAPVANNSEPEPTRIRSPLSVSVPPSPIGLLTDRWVFLRSIPPWGASTRSALSTSIDTPFIRIQGSFSPRLPGNKPRAPFKGAPASGSIPVAVVLNTSKTPPSKSSCDAVLSVSWGILSNDAPVLSSIPPGDKRKKLAGEDKEMLLSIKLPSAAVTPRTRLSTPLLLMDTP